MQWFLTIGACFECERVKDNGTTLNKHRVRNSANKAGIRLASCSSPVSKSDVCMNFFPENWATDIRLSFRNIDVRLMNFSYGNIWLWHGSLIHSTTIKASVEAAKKNFSAQRITRKSFTEKSRRQGCSDTTNEHEASRRSRSENI